MTDSADLPDRQLTEDEAIGRAKWFVEERRGTRLLDALALAGRPVDRAGSGLVAEVYPAAALHGWRLPDVGYKRAAGAAALGGLVDQLFDAAPFLALDADAEARCRASDDAFDALVAALVARAVTLGLTDPPNLEERERAGREGWIHLPRGGLSALVGES